MEELGVARQPVEAKSRGEGKFLDMEAHGKHPCELEQGFSRGCVEAAGHDFDHGVLDALQHVDEPLGAVRAVPQLAAVCVTFDSC